MCKMFPSIRQRPLAALLRVSVTAAGLAAAPAWAQSRHNVVGTPLDTLMGTRLTADVPEAKDFVTASRPDVKKLDYTPLTGAVPERPKPRDPTGIKALQAELEGAGAKNTQKAKGLISAKQAGPEKKKPVKAGE
jgi:hypothetical protein